MILGGTGHRPSKLGHEYSLSGPVSSFIRNEIILYLRANPEIDTIISGMALGFDSLFAEVGINESQIKKVIASIPFVGQEKKWPMESQKFYNWLLSDPKVEKVIVCEGGYSPHKMQIRNQWIVDNSDEVITCYDGDTLGGTKNCINYARYKNKKIYRIWLNKDGSKFSDWI